MVDIRVRPEKCGLCQEGESFMRHRNPDGVEVWLCRECVDVLIDKGKKALNIRDCERAGNGG